MGIFSQRKGRKCPGWKRLFMFAALTPLPIDLCSEWSVNTAEQTQNGTVKQTRMPYHSVPGLPVCSTVRGACVNDTLFLHSDAHECTHTPQTINTHYQTELLYNKMAVTLLPCLFSRCIFLSGRKLDVNLKALVLTWLQQHEGLLTDWYYEKAGVIICD